MDFQQLLEQIRNIKNKYPSGSQTPKGGFNFLKNLTFKKGKIPVPTTKTSKELEALHKKILDTYAQSLMMQEVSGTRYLTVEELMKQGFTESEAERRSKEPISGSYRLNPDMTMKEAMAQAERDFERAINIVEAEPIDPSMLEGVGMQQAPGMPQPVFRDLKDPSDGQAKYIGDQIDLLKDFDQKEIDELLKGTDVDLQTLQTLLAKEKAKGTEEGDKNAKKLQDQIDAKTKSQLPVPDLAKGSDKTGDTTPTPAAIPAATPAATPAGTPDYNFFLNREDRDVELAQVPLSSYTAALPSMLPGGSIAPMEATYEGMMPQLQAAYKMAQRLKLTEADPASEAGVTGTYQFERWLQSDPDIRSILTAGLDRLESLRAHLNSKKTDEERNIAINNLGFEDQQLFQEYLAPTRDADGSIIDAFAGAKNELALRQTLNSYLPESTRYAANQALLRRYRQGMVGDPLGQYNIYQGMGRPPGFGETAFPYDETVLSDNLAGSPAGAENFSNLGYGATPATVDDNKEIDKGAPLVNMPPVPLNLPVNPDAIIETGVPSITNTPSVTNVTPTNVTPTPETATIFTPPVTNVIPETATTFTPPINPPIPGGPTIMGTQQPNDFTKYGIQQPGTFASQSYWNAYANQNPPPPGFVYSNTGNLIPIGGVI